MTRVDSSRRDARIRRSLAALGAGALSMGALVPFAAPASADDHIQDLQAACAGLMDDTAFSDIGGLHAETQGAINCLAAYGITRGRTPDRYAPSDPVKRYEMAIFLERLIDYVDDNDTVGLDFASNTTDAGFDDIAGVPTAGINAINVIANLGIAQGKSTSVYDPFSAVSRRDMASFINRVQDAIAEQDTGAGYDPGAATKTFDDVPSTLARAGDIYALEGAGIVRGTSANTYKPYANVLRSEMAFFVMRHLNENIADGRVLPFDETAPGAATVTAPAAAVRTSATSYTIMGTGAEAGATVQVRTSTGDVAGSAAAASDGTFSVTVPLSANSANEFAVVVVDASGNASAPTSVPTITHDDTAPGITGAVATGTTVVFTADEELDAASITSGDITETSASGIDGVSATGAVITVTFDAPLSQGEVVTLAADSVADLAGNTGPAADVAVTVPDTTAPAAATVGTPSQPVVTNEQTYDIAGTGAEAGATVQVRTSTGAVAGSATATAEGTFTVTATLAANAANDFVVVVVDEAGNVSAEAAVPTITHDNTAPTVTASAVTAGATTVEFTVNEAVEATSVAVEDITDTAAAAVLDAVGAGTTITVTFDAPLAEGDVVTLNASSVTDLAGNPGPAAAESVTVAAAPL